LNEIACNVVFALFQEKFQPSNVTYNDLVSSGNMNIISNDSIKIYLFELSLLYQSNSYNNEHETTEYDEGISKPIFKLTYIKRMKPIFLNLKTAEQVNLLEEDFKVLFASQEFKSGCVVLDCTSEALIDSSKIFKSKYFKLLELIKKELLLK
jgi:hypothetical protein